MSDSSYSERFPDRRVQRLLPGQNQGAGQGPRFGQEVPHPRFDPSPETRPGSREPYAGDTLVDLHLGEQKRPGRGGGCHNGVRRPLPRPYGTDSSPGGERGITPPLERPDGALAIQAADQAKWPGSCAGPALEPTRDRPFRSIRHMEPAVTARRSTLRVGRKATREHGQGKCRRHCSSVHGDGKPREYFDGLSCVGCGPKRPQKTRANQWQNGKANKREGERGREKEAQHRV